MSSPRTVVILGASANPARYSNMLMRRLHNREGYRAIPVNPAQEEIEGAPVHASLDAVASSLGSPDILTLYVSPSRSAALEAEILRLGPRRVIFNPGAENPALESALNRAGIVTENACSLVLLSQGAL
ncbi:MAG: CoA-binding protein [Fibrobacteria bacterium]|jgi:predicted CoA-binding protein|nr:CoA-binding protein [Fibrobacteria bacterium]